MLLSLLLLLLLFLPLLRCVFVLGVCMDCVGCCLEKGSDWKLLLECGVSEQCLLVKLELLLGPGRGVGGAQVVRPQVCAVDEGGTQCF